MSTTPSVDDRNSDEWVYLTTCGDDQEVDIIESFLLEANILLVRKYSGAGEYMKIIGGMTRIEVRLYVKESQLDEAREIIKAISMSITEDDKTAETESTVSSYEKTPKNKSKKRLLIMAFLYLIPIVTVLIMSYWNSLKALWQ